MVSTTNDVDHEWPPKKFDHLDIVMPLTPVAYVPDTGMPNDQLEKVDGEPFKTGKPYTYPHISESVHGACGQCKFFIEGGSCAFVKGIIDPIKGTCKFWEGGQPLDSDTRAFPLYEQIEAEYHEDSYEPYLTEITHEPLSACSCNKIIEGGVGSGIKGHTTADDPKTDRSRRSLNDVIDKKEVSAVKNGFQTSLSKYEGSQWVNDLQNPILSRDSMKTYKAAKKTLDDMLKNDPETKEKYDRHIERVEILNQSLARQYENTASVYRGTRIGELDEYLETGKIGGDKNNYDFVSTSLDKGEADFFNRGVIIEYDAPSTRKHGGTLVKYTGEPVPFKSQESGSAFKNLEGDDKPMTSKFADEQEVRLPEGTSLKDIKIKSIKIGLGKFLRPDDFDMDKKISDEKSAKRMAEVKKDLIAKYSKLGTLKFVRSISFFSDDEVEM